jgi:hypothetical protein
MHYEIAGKILDIEVLQQKAHLAVMKVGNAVRVGCLDKANVLIEAFRKLEIPRRHKRFDLNRSKIGHLIAPFLAMLSARRTGL